MRYLALSLALCLGCFAVDDIDLPDERTPEHQTLLDGGVMVSDDAGSPDAGPIPNGSACQQTICLTDYYATVAQLIDRDIPSAAGEDSFSFLSLLHAPEADHHRPPVIHHSGAGMLSDTPPYKCLCW